MRQGLWRTIEIGLLVVIGVIDFVILARLDDGGEFSKGSVTGVLVKMALLGFFTSIFALALTFMRKSTSFSLFLSAILIGPICLYIIDDRVLDFLEFPKSVMGGYNSLNVSLASAEAICFVTVGVIRMSKSVFDRV